MALRAWVLCRDYQSLQGWQRLDAWLRSIGLRCERGGGRFPQWRVGLVGMPSLARRLFVEAHTFTVVAQDGYGWLSAEEAASFRVGLGWPVVQRVEVVSSEESANDALVLAHLVLGLAERLGGVVDCGGELPPLASGGSGWAPEIAALTLACRKQVLASFPGRVYEVASEDSEGDLQVRHVLDVAFFAAWLAQPSCPLVELFCCETLPQRSGVVLEC